MIDVKINTTGETKSIEISGHADYAEHGHDIVCAAVSTIFQIAVLGLVQMAKQYKGYIRVRTVEDEE